MRECLLMRQPIKANRAASTRAEPPIPNIGCPSTTAKMATVPVTATTRKAADAAFFVAFSAASRLSILGQSEFMAAYLPMPQRRRQITFVLFRDDTQVASLKGRKPRLQVR